MVRSVGRLAAENGLARGMPLSLSLKWKLERIGAQTHFAQGGSSVLKEVGWLERGMLRSLEAASIIRREEKGNATVLPNRGGASQFR